MFEYWPAKAIHQKGRICHRRFSSRGEETGEERRTLQN